MWYIAQGLGIVGMVFAFLSFQGNTKKHVGIFQTVASLMFAFDFLLLTLSGEDALAGSVLNFINAAKCFVGAFASDPKHKWANINVWMPIFLVAVIVASIVTWSVWYCILSTVGIVLVTVAYWPKKPRSIRLIYLTSAPCWLIYDFLTANYPGVATECFNLVSLTIAFIRFDILGQKESSRKSKSADKA